MQDIFKVCPVIENERFLLRQVSREDCADLLKVYSDERAVPFFNSDNCVDDLHYKTAEEMLKAIDFWLDEYRKRYYIRWSIIDKTAGEAVGTVEYYIRQSEDYFTDCGLLRLDLRSDWEKAVKIRAILDLIIEPLFEFFPGSRMATKAIPTAAERIFALEKSKFRLSPHKLIGRGGTEYGNYYILRKTK